MGRTEAQNYEPINTDIHTSFQEVVPVASTVTATATANVIGGSPSQLASSLAGNFTWTDHYYENEPGIVAVFDLDLEVIQLYQNKAAAKFTVGTIIMVVAFMIYVALDLVVFAVIFTMFSGLFFLLAMKSCQKAQASQVGGLHLAVTSSSVRYDQENPLLTTEISLKSIHTCTVAQKKFRRFPWSSEATLNMVIMQIAGARAPKVYVGLKNPQDFARLVMTLKNNMQDHPKPAALNVV